MAKPPTSEPHSDIRPDPHEEAPTHAPEPGFDKGSAEDKRNAAHHSKGRPAQSEQKPGGND